MKKTLYILITALLFSGGKISAQCSIGGSVSANQTICSGTSPTDLSLSGQTGSVLRWQQSSDIDFTSPVNIPVTATTLTGVTIGSLTSSTYFRAEVQEGTCTSVYSTSVLITVDEATVGGSVSADQTICSGSVPADLVLSGQTGTVQKWQKASDAAFTLPADITSAVATLPGTTIGSLTSNTYFRAVVKSGACSEEYSTSVLITVKASAGGSVTSDQTLCSGATPADLALSGQSGSIVKWQKASEATFASATDIAETTAALTGATIGPLTSSTYFRAVVQEGTCDVAYSSPALITINLSIGGTVSSSQSICSGSVPAGLSLAGHAGLITEWQKSSDATFSSPVSISETSASLSGATIGALTSSTYFRAIVQDGSCPTAESSSVLITVDAASVGGSVSAAQSICSGSVPAGITLSGHTGAVLRWQKSSDAAFTTPVNITGTTTTLAGATIGALTSTTYFRAVVKSGACSEVPSAAVLITVSPTTVGGTVSGVQTVCNGVIPADLTLSGYTGNILRWEKSGNSSFTSPVTFANTTATLTGAEIGSLTASTYFRAVVKSGVCSEDPSSNVKITVHDVFSASINSSPATICYNDSPGTFTATASGGDTPYTYQWYNTVTGIMPTETGSTLTPGSMTISKGFYCVVTSHGTCGSITSLTKNITVRPQLTLSSVSQQSAVCAGSPAVINLIGVNTGITPKIDYTIGGIAQAQVTGDTEAGSGNSKFSKVLTIGNNGKILQVTTITDNATGCFQAVSPSATLIVNPIPTPVISGAIVACAGNTKTYSTIAGMDTYTWFVDGVDISGPVALNSIDINWTTAGTKTVMVRCTSNSCTADSPGFNVEVSAIPAPSILAGPAAVCMNSAGNVYTTQPGMKDYTWTVSAGGTITSAQDGNFIVVSWNASGLQSVGVSYTNPSGCTAAAPGTQNVTVNSLPVVALNGPLFPRINNVNDYTTDALMTGYTWSFSGGGTASATGNVYSINWNTTGPQTISVNYKNSDGCSATLPEIKTINIMPLPKVTGVAITGYPGVGVTLEGTYTYSDGYDDGSTVGTDHSTYRWLRNGTVLVGTSKTYVPAAADRDQTLTFEVTPVSNIGPPYDGTPVSFISDPIEDLTGAPVADEVCIDGIKEAGRVIRGEYRYTYSKSEGVSTYRWLRKDFSSGIITDLGVHTVQYTLTPADVDDNVAIIFEVTPVSSNKTPKTGAPVQSKGLARFTIPKTTYSVSEPDITLTAVEPGGVFSGSGVSGNIFSPKSAGLGNYTIAYMLNIINSTTSCSQQAFKPVTVSVTGSYFEGFNAVYCNDGAEDVISVANLPGGAWDFQFWCTDADAIVSKNMLTPSVTIDPKKMQAGVDVDKLYFSYRDAMGIYYEISQSFVVDKVSKEIKLVNLEDAYCKDSPKKYISVAGIYPVGGTAEWTSILFSDQVPESAYINPSKGTPGSSYPVSYKYISPLGCFSNIVKDTVRINPLPNPSFALNSTQNIDGGAVALTPVQSGGTFNGDGISGRNLFPDIAGLGPHSITYSIRDNNGCDDTLSLTTTVRQALAVIEDIPFIICYDDTTFRARVTNLPDTAFSIVGFSSFKKTLTYTPGSITADYYVPAAGSGEDTLVFSYKWYGVDFTVRKPVYIDSLDQVTLRGITPGQVVCTHEGRIDLIPSVPNGVFTGPVTGGFLDPSKSIPGKSDYVISYEYTSNKTFKNENTKSLCSTSISVPVKIYPSPVVSFAPVDTCITDDQDATFFIDHTSSADSVKLWVWKFNDVSGTKTVTITEPGKPASYLYRSGGLQKISLTATTVNGCAVTKEMTYNFGKKPVADFYWKNDCMHAGDSIELVDTTSVFNAAVISRSWKHDGIEFETGRIARYPKTATGFLSIEYTVRTAYAGCNSTITKDIYIRPLIPVSADGYFQDFESGTGGWIKNDTCGIWAFGSPDGFSSPKSGANAWYTGNVRDGQAFIESPCFDFTGSERPVIKMDIFKYFEKDRDGAALQYKLGDSREWQYVGTMDDGIEWYNSAIIRGKPGGNQLGWTTTGTPDEDWKPAIHTLDELRDKKDVKFRIAYGSEGIYTKHSGFAFDNVSIGERSRRVLLEHFTNSADIESRATDAIVGRIATNKDKDVINIQYHTNFPGTDSFYVSNPGDASARILFYGLTKVPYTFIDGGTNRYYAMAFDNTMAKIDSNFVTKRSLVNSPFKMSVNAVISGGVLNVSGNVTAVENIKAEDAENLTLFIAVVEKQHKLLKDNREETFLNVFRKFIPDAGGVMLRKSSWAKGETLSLGENVWIIEKVLNSSNIEIIAFLQNPVTKEIYQGASVIKPQISVGVEDPPSGLINDFSIFPNPARDRITIEFGEALRDDAEIRIYNIRGDAVRIFTAGSGSREYTIENPGLMQGIYMVRVSSGRFSIGYKKLIIRE